MKADVKAQWITELRSGDWAQGTGVLHRMNDEGKHFYCCLGVLCELAVKAGVLPEAVKGRDGVSSWMFQYEAPEAHHNDGINATTLPRSVRAWAGVDHEDIIIDPDGNGFGLPMYASGANDSGMSFDEIADLIEKNVKAA